MGGHVNHSIWWKNLSPNGGDEPTGEFAANVPLGIIPLLLNPLSAFPTPHGNRRDRQQR